MIGENEFVIDRVLASLTLLLDTTEENAIFTNIHGRVKFNLVGSEIRTAGKNDGLRTSVLSLPSPR